jgi:hypothetical protein
MSPINNTEQLTVQYTLQHSFTNLRISYGRNQGRKMLEHSSRKTTEIYLSNGKPKPRANSKR